jgi:hypothetical protein
MQLPNYQVTITKSKNNINIPVVNGVYLHSVYDPIKEADSLIEQHSDTLKKESNFLVLGLGFAFHIQALSKALYDIHGSKYKIFVVEPNSEIVALSEKENPVASDNVSIICKETVDDYYSNNEFVNFLLQKPSIIPHTATFNIYRNFFKEIMSFKKHNAIDVNRKILANPTIRNLIEENPNNSFTESVHNAILSPSKNDQNLFLLKIFDLEQKNRKSNESKHTHN